MPDTMPVAPPSKDGEPTWGIALLFPAQGEWSEAKYLALETNHLVELCDGLAGFSVQVDKVFAARTDAHP